MSFIQKYINEHLQEFDFPLALIVGLLLGAMVSPVVFK